MVDIDSILHKRRLSQQFLHLAYIRCEGWRLYSLVFRDLMHELNITEQECYRIEDDLSARGLIKRFTVGLNGTFHLTHNGILQAEKDILEGNYKLDSIKKTSSEQPLPTASEMKQCVTEEQKRRSEFILLAYEEAINNPGNSVVVRDIAEKLGLTEKEILRFEDFMESEYLIDGSMHGGIDGWISMTDWGIQYVEEAILSANAIEKPLKRIRSDRIKPIALAIYFTEIDIQFDNLRDAAKRFGTTTRTVNARRNDPKVKDALKRITEDSNYRYRVRSQVSKQVSARRQQKNPK